MLPYNKYIKSLSEAPDKLSKLKLDADMDDFIRQAVMDESLKVARREARDLAEGLNSDPMISAIEEAMRAKYKFTMPELLDGGESFKAKAVAEAVASGDINKIIDVYPLVQDNEMAKAAIEEMVARTKDPNKAFALENKTRRNQNKLDMAEIDQDARINEALDKLAGKREIIDEASVGGFSDNVTPELTGMRVADDQMFGNELFDIKLKDRTEQNRAYDSSFDKFLTQEGVDVSVTDRYNRAVLDEMIRLAKEHQAIDRSDVLHTRRNLHKDPVMRDKLDDKGTLPVEAIKAYKERKPGKSEQFLNYLRKDFAKKKSENPELKDREIMKMLANDWVPNRKGFGMVTTPEDVHPGNPRGNAKVTDSMNPSYLEVLESKRDKLMSKIVAARSNGNEDAVDNLTKQLDDVNDKIIMQKDFEKSIIDAENNREAEMIMDQFESPDVLEKKNPKPMNESMAWHNELDYYDKQAAKEGRKYKKYTNKEINEQLIKDAAKLGNRDRGVPLYRGSIRAKPKYVSEKEILRGMWRKKGTEIPKEDYKKITEPAKTGGKLNKPATEAFIKNVAKEHGFELTGKRVKDLLRMTRQEVIDFIENLANP